VFGIWVAGHIALSAVNHGRVGLVDFGTAIVTGVVVASGLAYAVHRPRGR
jgi:hypothetical protein